MADAVSALISSPVRLAKVLVVLGVLAVVEVAAVPGAVAVAVAVSEAVAVEWEAQSWQYR